MDLSRETVSLGCLGLGLSIVCWLFLSGCETAKPKLDVNYWAGDAAKAGISRSQTASSLSCSDPKFDEFVCLSAPDFMKLTEVLGACQN
jgi:hypothetical protein